MTDDETELMRDQLSHILDQFEVLDRVDTEGVRPTGHSADVESVMREDESSASSPRDDVLRNAPQTESDFVRVRAVLD